jgi:hypothetical protein
VTIAIAPLWDETARLVEVIWVEREGKYFCKWGWTGVSPERLSGKTARLCGVD